jgi:hypothetical protein
MPIKTIDLMLGQHPQSLPGAREFHAEAIAALVVCQQICTSCADACLGEKEHVDRLLRCIRTDLDCADICAVTERVLTRQTETNGSLVQAQLHACIVACQLCADECASHASMHSHCATCAEACRHCQAQCNRLLGELSSSGVREDAGT